MDGETLSGTGHPYNINRSYDLHEGANLVSFPFNGSVAIVDALPDDIASQIETIIAEGQSTINGDLIISPTDGLPDESVELTTWWLGSLTEFEGGRGYWINIKEGVDPEPFSFIIPHGDIYVDDNGGDNSPRESSSGSQVAEIPEGLEYIQSSEQAFYYVNPASIEELNLEHGDWFVSTCGSNVSGSRQYLGAVIDIPVMGYDGHPMTAGYCEKDDRPEFKLYKTSTGEMIELHAEVSSWDSNEIFIVENMTVAPPVPTDFSVLSAYPNPFNPVTSIGYEIPEESMVEIIIYDLRGQEVATLVNELTIAGRYDINWDAHDVASGIYFVNFTASRDGFAPVTKMQKLMLVK
jgi:hypothetical protein